MTSRSGFVVRPAALADLDAITELCLAAREESSASKSVCPPEPDRVRGYVRALFGESGVRLNVVVDQASGGPVGFVASRTVPAGPFADAPRVQIESIYVAKGSRRKGAGHVLLEAVALQAADAKAPEVVCLPLIGTRSLPRFFARVGFAPVGSHRVIGSETLARRVTREPAVVAERAERRRGLEELIAVRRRRRDTGEIPKVPPYSPRDGADRNRQVRRAVANRRPSSSP